MDERDRGDQADVDRYRASLGATTREIERDIARIAEAARHVPAGVRAPHRTIP